MEDFHYQSLAQEIIFGPGSLERLREAVERAGWQRVMLVTSRSLAANGQAAAVQSALGACLAAVYDRVQPHVQQAQLDEVLSTAQAGRIDAVIGLGGGSPIGMAKAAAHALDAGPRPAVIAIPTTYAGSEMTPIFGVTGEVDGRPRKQTVNDPRAAARLVIYDPRLTLDLPPGLTASTGINALAHCIEALYSVTRHPLSAAAALEGMRRIVRALPQCYDRPDFLEARSEMMLGAHLAGFSLASVKMALHHGLCHVLGGSYGVPHGIANSIVLPHAVRFNAGTAEPQLVQAADAAGIPVEDRPSPNVVEDLAQHISGLTRRLDLPQRLRDAGIRQADLPEIARAAAENRTVQNNPRPVTADLLERLLEEAW